MNDDSGINTNFKRFPLLRLALKYFNIIFYYTPLPNLVITIGFVISAIAYGIILTLRLKETFNFSSLINNVEMIGLSLCLYYYTIPIIMNIFDLRPSNGDMALIIVGNIVLIILILLITKYFKRYILCKEFTTIKSIPAKEVFIYEMMRCILSTDLDDNIYLSGMIKSH